MADFAAILLAAGRSSRFRQRDKKPFADLDGRAVWLRSLELFSVRENVRQILIVVAEEDMELFDRRYRSNVAFLDVAQVVKGGAERFDSVAAALAEVRPEIDFIAVHDAARPCLTTELIDRVFGAAEKSGAAILAAKVADTLKRGGEGGQIVETVPRDGLWAAQTPQVFARDLLLRAYANRSRVPPPITDDAQLVEALGHPVALVESDASNLKITTENDLGIAAAILKGRPAAKPKNYHPFADEKMW